MCVCVCVCVTLGVGGVTHTHAHMTHDIRRVLLSGQMPTCRLAKKGQECGGGRSVVDRETEKPEERGKKLKPAT